MSVEATFCIPRLVLSLNQGRRAFALQVVLAITIGFGVSVDSIGGVARCGHDGIDIFGEVLVAEHVILPILSSGLSPVIIAGEAMAGHRMQGEQAAVFSSV